MTFGTGRHETTRSCLTVLETIDIKGKSVFDLGCGSGILSIYCALHGASTCIGYDIDPLCQDNCKENIRENNVEDVCEAYTGTIYDFQKDTQFEIVIANIIKEVIIPILPRLKRLTKPGGDLILSGLLIKDRKEIEEALDRNNLSKFNPHFDNEWVTYRITV